MFRQLLTKISQTLDQEHIPYMVIGGQAVLLYGVPRLTKDIDITLGVGIDQLPKIKNIAHTLKLTPLVQDEGFIQRTMVYPCLDPESGIRVDFIFSFSPYERQALERINPVRIHDVIVKFASVEDVIIHKVIAGRPRDIEDVRTIMLKNPDIDLHYIRKWLQVFQKSLKEPYLKKFEQVVKSTSEPAE